GRCLKCRHPKFGVVTRGFLLHRLQRLHRGGDYDRRNGSDHQDRNEKFHEVLIQSSPRNAPWRKCSVCRYFALPINETGIWFARCATWFALFARLLWQARCSSSAQPMISLGCCVSPPPMALKSYLAMPASFIRSVSTVARRDG